MAKSNLANGCDLCYASTQYSADQFHVFQCLLYCFDRYFIVYVFVYEYIFCMGKICAQFFLIRYWFDSTHELRLILRSDSSSRSQFLAPYAVSILSVNEGHYRKTLDNNIMSTPQSQIRCNLLTQSKAERKTEQIGTIY